MRAVGVDLERRLNLLGASDQHSWFTNHHPGQGCEVFCIGPASSHAYQYASWRKVTAVLAMSTGVCAIHGEARNVSCAGFLLPLDVTATEVSSIHTRPDGGIICALKSNGQLVCWTPPCPPGYPCGGIVPENLPPFKSFSMGSSHSCGITNNAGVVCFGGSSALRNDKPAAGLNSVVQLASGNEFTCALMKNGSVSCWQVGVDWLYSHAFGVAVRCMHVHYPR